MRNKKKALGGRVLVSVQPELAELVATCPGIDQVVPHGVPLPVFDLQLSLFSLPQVFRTRIHTIPKAVPYLALPARIPNREALTRFPARAANGMKVGVAWAGNPIHPRDKERSLLPETLAPLGTLAGVCWYSFQVGRDSVAPLPGVFDLAPHLSNFSDTAYALSGMDLVLCADISLAHLAGALGVPTLLMLPFLPDWRWLMERQDSPWYPTMRLYRQPEPGNWDAVIQQLLRDLR